MIQTGRPREERDSARAHSWSLRGDPVLSQLNPWAEVPEALVTHLSLHTGGMAGVQGGSCLSTSSLFLFLKASIAYFHNKVVLCQAL